MLEVKLIYFNDSSSGIGYSSRMVDDDYQLSIDELMTAPGTSLIPPMVIKNGEWIGQNFDSEDAPILTKQDEINAQLFKMDLDLQLKLKELESNG